MKKSLLTAFFIGAVISAQAQMVPAPSPLAKVHQTVGLTNIEVEYSRPSLKERSLFGEIIEPGKLWRTGANMATKITFDDNVNIGGTDVRAGEYAIFTVPDEKQVVFFLNSDANQGGTGNYDESKTVAKMSARMGSSGVMVESMRFTFEDLTSESANLVWAWEKSTFSIPIKVSTREKAVANIEAKMSEVENRYSLYNQAAGYYLDSGLDRKKALEWSLQSVEISEKFWNMHTLAKAYLAVGDTKNAMKTAQKSLDMAKEADYDAYVKMNEKLIKEIKSK